METHERLIDSIIKTTNMKKTDTITQRLLFYLNPIDGRYEDLVRGRWQLNALRDITAGLIVAMVAIPLAMGFAMASGLEPEQGIVGGAIAGLLGALFGGSKYQVYGPTAAYIPVIGALMATYNHSFLVLVSGIAGVMLLIMGLAKMGKLIALVPHSIVVGFTIGIAIVIAFSQIGEVLGLPGKLGYNLADQIPNLLAQLDQTNLYALVIALVTFALCKTLLRVSIYIPAPLIAFGVALLLANLVWADKGLILIRDKYGNIPTDFLVFTMPALPALTPTVIWDIIYFSMAILFVAAVESLLCSRMADRLANNQGVPYNPNKELWGQGMVNIITPLFNGFPHTGALARTAVNIRVGAVSPLAGIAKFTLKLLLAAYLATYLEVVPMACIGGILLYVAHGMVKKMEVRLALSHNKFHIFLMAFTAVMVPLFGFMPGVLSAIVIYALLKRFFDKKHEPVSTPVAVAEEEK